MAQESSSLKPLLWVGSSLEDLRELPEEPRGEIGHALYEAQLGRKHESAKPLKGFGGGQVLEVVESDDGNAYRAVYTVRFADAVAVLHVFQKKSKRGAETPMRDMELIRHRLKRAQEVYDAWKAEHEEEG